MVGGLRSRALAVAMPGVMVLACSFTACDTAEVDRTV